MAWIKRTFVALLIVFLLLAGAAAWLLMGIDVNRYKPQLEQLAAKQGIALRLDGDIGWQIWPNIALELEGVKLAPLPQPDQPLVQAEKVAVGVALMPLLQKRIEAQEILLMAPQIDLVVDEEGRGNWELLTEAMEAQREQQAGQPPQLEVPTEPAEPGSQQLNLALEKLRIEDGRISYRDASADSEYQLSQLAVTADNLVPGGEPGQVQATAEVVGSALKQPVSLNIDSTLALDEGLNGLRLQPLELVAGSGEAAAKIYLRGSLRRSAADKPWQIQLTLNAEAQPLRPWLAVTGSELTTQSGAALEKFTLETNIEGTDRKLDMTPLQLQLDDTVFAGSAQLRNGDMPGIDLTLRGGELVLDDYLPPPAPEAEAEQVEPTEPAPPTPLPLTAMRGFNANLDLSLDRLQAVQVIMDRPQLQLTVDNGLFQLQKLSADLYGGQLNTNGQFNARGQSAVARLSGGLADVEISKIQGALFPSERVQVSGKSSITWSGQSGGVDTAELQKNLRAAVQVSSEQLYLSPFNLEKGMCQLVSFVEKTTLPERQWENRTRLQDLRVNILVEGDKVKVQEVLAGVENIALTGDGTVDLEQQDFDFALGLSLVGEKTSADGCSVQNSRWRNRPLPLRCKDKFDEAGAGSCKPDSRRIDDLIRDELKYKAEKKYGDKVKEKVDDLKDKFKGLFNRGD
ncbi:putative assembly protein [Microbulbifer aggregans]|uniref:Putative assembly protein n=1 Tax=Microbulbifer aggregans TaxID=1769779 RepID=A0A1C9W4Q8_9GAMM|nr:AsmA family protein [Microbulbifer aggregans]AOS96129.1 putative assembly protein [Microbulbifer aggregans]